MFKKIEPGSFGTGLVVFGGIFSKGYILLTLVA